MAKTRSGGAWFRQMHLAPCRQAPIWHGYAMTVIDPKDDPPSEAPGEAPAAYLTVHEMAALLRVKDRKVYDMAAANEVPCIRLTGKLLFPRREIRAWMDNALTGGSGAVRPVRPPIFLGSHDPLLDWALRQSRSGLAGFFDGSGDGLRRFAKAEGVAAGLHLHDPDGAPGDGWNIHALADGQAGPDAVLVTWATRQRGLVMRTEHAPVLRDLGALAHHRIVPRQPGSGTQMLFDRLTHAAGLPPGTLTFGSIAADEDAAIAAVQGGAADVAFGLEALAAPRGLAFRPLIAERFDLLVDRRAWFAEPFQRFWAFATGPALVLHAATLPGYDISDLGVVRWNG
jgi:excisionase family DNA binding protein